jgi:signal transduction histidine kinase
VKQFLSPFIGRLLRRFGAAALPLLCVVPASPAAANGGGTVYISQDSLRSEHNIRLFADAQYYLGFRNWRYHSGDDPAWADPSFDDSSWETVDTRLFIGQLPKDGWAGIGWFRLHVELAPELEGEPIGILLCQIGAAEIYLDGTRFHSSGQVAASAEGERKRSVVNPSPLLVSFGGGKHHVIAVRYSNHASDWAHEHGFPAGFWMAARDYQYSVEQHENFLRGHTAYQALFVAVPLAFTLLHLLLFFFYAREKANLYYAIFTIGAAALTYCVFQIRFASNLRLWLVLFWFFKISLLVVLVSGVRFQYAVFYSRLPRRFWWLLAGAIVLGGFAWYLPEDVFGIAGMLVLVEMLRVVIRAILGKKDGAWIIGIGFGAFCVAVAWQALMGLGVLTRLDEPYGMVYLYGILGLIISMSVYLARSVAHVNKNLEAQLAQVRELSGHLERANQELGEYSQTLEKKVTERTHELSSKNVELEDTLGELRDTQIQLVQSEKMASLGSLVAGVTHELNTPVGVISSMHNTLIRAVDRLKETLSGSSSREDAEDKTVRSAFEAISNANEIITTGTERLMSIARNLREFARLDEAEFQVAHVHGGIDSTLALLKRDIGDGVAVEKDYGDIPPIYCSPGQLNQVFMTVLRNAAQAIDGAGEIRIKTFQEDETVHILISDTGVGIPPAQLERIFDLDFKAGESRVKMKFGLSTAYRIVQDHGGTVEIDSAVGRGTVVTISLPVRAK